jgi:hypothetical protein
VPEVAGLETAARYLPASRVPTVGGDWYLRHGRPPAPSPAPARRGRSHPGQRKTPR